MDSLTHLVAGALTPLAFRGAPKRAALVAFGIVVGELPDLDVLFGHDFKALLTLHRGITHAVFWQPVFILIAVIPFYIWMQCIRSTQMPLQGKKHILSNGSNNSAFTFGTMYVAALVATLTHIYLDCMTTFGTQALLPFSDMRVGFPAIFIVDLPLTLTAIALLVAALRACPDIVPISCRNNSTGKGIASSSAGCPLPASGSKNTLNTVETSLHAFHICGTAVHSSKARRLARLGLAWIIIYPLVSLGVNALAAYSFNPSATFSRQTADSGIASISSASDVIFMTEPFSPFVWKAIVDKGEYWEMSTFFLLGSKNDRLVADFIKKDRTLYQKLKKQHPIFADFETFSPFMVQSQRAPTAFVQSQYKEKITEYCFSDLRYRMSPESPAHWVGRDDPNFLLEARVNSSDALVAYRFLQRGKDVDTTWIILE